MATNEILQFASTDTGTNLLTQAEYAADAQRVTGNQPGIARSKLVNKAARQANLMASGLGHFIAQYQANNVVDTLSASQIADYLYNALIGSLAVTPPQFDNDTSLATTAFVQRALGNVGAVNYVMNSTTTIPSSKVGQTYISGGSTNTFNLPLTSSVPNGSTITIFCQGGTATVQRQGSDNIGVGVNTNNTSIFMRTNEYATFIAQDENWNTLGTPMLPDCGLFASNKAQSGYTRMANGVILQWGRVNAGNTGGMFDVSLPITFPNAGWVGVACDWSGSVVGADINAVDFVSTTTMRVWCSTNADGVNESNFWWFAVGN